FYAVSPVGAAMLRETLESGPVVAVRNIAAAYGVEAEQVQADLGDLLRDLEQKGVIRRRGSSLPRHPWRRRLARAAIPLLLPGTDRRAVRAARWRAWGLVSSAWISIALFGWSATVRSWQQHYARVPIRPYPAALAGRAARLDALVRTVTAEHLLYVDCKERA